MILNIGCYIVCNARGVTNLSPLKSSAKKSQKIKAEKKSYYALCRLQNNLAPYMYIYKPRKVSKHFIKRSFSYFNVNRMFSPYMHVSTLLNLFSCMDLKQ